MELKTAQSYAARIVEWLAPHCERIEIAGSIRRLRPVCNDVDLVCLPKREEVRDMFGEVLSSKNLTARFLWQYVEAADRKASVITGGGDDQKQMIIHLPKCQLDLWFAEPKNFGTRLLCRTGSKEHNILLAQRALDLGRKWDPYEGVTVDGRLRPAEYEQQIYDALKLPWIEPRDREGEFVANLIRGCVRENAANPPAHISHAVTSAATPCPPQP